MTVTLSWEAMGVVAAWATLILLLIGRLMKRFNDLDRKFTKKFSEIDERFNEHATEDLRDHAAVHAQVADIALTSSNTYMRRREMEIMMRDLNATMTEIRKDVGAAQSEIRKEVGGVNNRIDTWIRERHG